MRLRFAPSPTGNLHIGSVRTALFNWVYSRHANGTLVLRIEDTDLQRSKPEYEANIIEGLEWLGLTMDEAPANPGNYGPYRQSERITQGIYADFAQQLIQSGHAYYCFETEEELAAERDLAESEGRPYVYSGASLRFLKEEVAEKLATGVPHTIRLKVPKDRGAISLRDEVRGEITFDSALLGDFIIMKSDGSAAYNFAVVVDDMQMEITHIVRSEDHISNTPRQVLVYEAFGAKVPVFAHLPIILGPDKSKLSKRHGAKSVTEYREDGFLPEAILNYLSLLGWTPADGVELMDTTALIDKFDVQRISKSGAVFDHQKLIWMNGQYVRNLSRSEFENAVTPFMDGNAQDIISALKDNQRQMALALFQDSVGLLPDINQQLLVLDKSFSSFQSRVSELPWKPDAKSVLAQFLLKIKDMSDVSSTAVDAAIQKLLEDTGLGKGKVLKPIRMAATGYGSGPHLPDLISLLGIDVIKERLQYVVDSQFS